MHPASTLNERQIPAGPDFDRVEVVGLKVHKKNPLGEQFRRLAGFFQGHNYYLDQLNKAAQSYNETVDATAQRSSWKLGSIILGSIATAAAAVTGFWIAALASSLVMGTAYKAADIGALKLKTQQDNAVEEIGSLEEIAHRFQQDAHLEQQRTSQRDDRSVGQETEQETPKSILREDRKQQPDAVASVQNELDNQELTKEALQIITAGKGRSD